MDSVTVVVIGSCVRRQHRLSPGPASSVTLVDQHALGSQTSPRAAGLTSKADATPVLAQLRHEACDAFERFESEMGQGVDFHRSGSLKAAYTEAGEAHLHEALENARAFGIEARVVSAQEAKRLSPHFEPGPARAIGHVPSDGWLQPARSRPPLPHARRRSARACSPSHPSSGCSRRQQGPGRRDEGR
jgi:4-methylaminobutanoate oxidase (formaldehyde-forming)